MGPIIADRTTDILINRTGDAINDKRFPISTQEAIMEILNGHPQVAKCFVKKLLQPFRVARSARSDKCKAEIVWNALNVFNAPNRQLGLTEKLICSFALSCLHHNDPEVRNMGKNIFIYMYCSEGVDTELIRSHLPHLSKYTYEKNPLLRSLRDEFEQFDRSVTTTKNKGQAAKAEGSAKRMRVPKLEDGKRPRTVTVVVNEGHASSSNRPDSVDYDKMCMFCGEINETFTPEGLDEHYLHNCYMLTRCHLCDEVVEVSTLNEHLLDECTNKSTLRKCMRCHEPILKNHFSQHVSTQRCKVARSDTIAGRCLLCHMNISPNNDIGWRKHLRDYCKYNPRRSNKQYA
uniref:Centrosomal protein CEP104 Zn finger domain-containing protein n=1 Tax=Ascaris suum TaxID=6253 RepID=F1L8Y3_ASCSU